MKIAKNVLDKQINTITITTASIAAFALLFLYVDKQKNNNRNVQLVNLIYLQLLSLYLKIE